MLTRFFMAVLLVGLLDALVHAQAKSWPDIVPLEASVYFADASKAAAWFKILSPNGKPLYILQCYNWRSARDPDFDYSGDFECRLTSTYSKEAYSTLLTDDPKQSRDWQSRGRVLAEELVGKCADYPEYGRVRHFRLRKMKITFSFDEMSFKPFESSDRRKVNRREFQSLRFSVRVEPDSKALSNIAEPVAFAEPPNANPQDPDDFSRQCDVIVKKK